MGESKRVSEWELRKMFAELDLYNRATSSEGDLRAILIDTHAPDPRNDQPAGVVSRTYRYVHKRPQTGSVLSSVATVHQYEHPDGSIAASGKADPKAIRVGETLYIADKSLN